MANTVADLVYLGRENPNLMKWESSKTICKLLRLNEMQYEEEETENGRSRFTGSFYEMSGQKPTLYELIQYSSNLKGRASSIADTVEEEDEVSNEEFGIENNSMLVEILLLYLEMVRKILLLVNLAAPLGSHGLKVLWRAAA